MNIPVNKNKRWVAGLHESIDQLDQAMKSAIVQRSGKACAADLLSLCEKRLGRPLRSTEDLRIAWNMLRDDRNLGGRWEVQGNDLRGIFDECGCPLVRSGLVELHPVQCHCSQAMMEAIFSQVTRRTIEVEIKRSIGRGDDVCDFLIKL
jgi:hypothetical protein